MRTFCSMVVAVVSLIATGVYLLRALEPKTPPQVITGKAAFHDFSQEKPGTFRKITVADLPPPFETESAFNQPSVVARPADAWPQALPGFKVELYATGLDNPRLIRTAPNGDLFLAESQTGKIKVFRGAGKNGQAETTEVFATGLEQPFGIAFFPPGPDPQWVYVGNTGSVVRFPYHSGDLKATGPAQVIVSDIPSGGRLTGGGHWTRDVVFSRDGKKMYVSVGSQSNVNDTDNNPKEFHRADVLEFNPDGSSGRVYAYGIRNCVGLEVNPRTGEVWCSTNERDGLGDDLVPDYITHVQEGGFYGWPWYYMGGTHDPRHAGKHPELKDKVITPDVILQPHFASLEMTFYGGKQFPDEYRGDVFAAEHGSWNRKKRTGYEVIRVPVKDGHATGEYEDFLTGFVTEKGEVWGRPVGVAVGKDGSLYVSDDGSRSIWRVSYPLTEAEAHPDQTLQAIAADIANLKPEFPQLQGFSVAKNLLAPNDETEGAIDYGFHTHRAQHPGGWSAQVPNPDPDGVWFYIDFHSPDSIRQIHTQPKIPCHCFGDKRLSFLMLQGKKSKPLSNALWEILEKHGVRSCPDSWM